MADAISPHALSELIGSIYDCALDPSRWEQTLPDVMDALDCRMLALHLTDLRHHRFLLNKTAGLEPYQVEQVPKYLPEINAIFGEALASWVSDATNAKASSPSARSSLESCCCRTFGAR